jgi:glutamate-ammonia-ligase adenylyltransferase
MELSDPIVHYVGLVDALRGPGDVGFDVRELGERRWLVAIAAADRLGALATIAGLFTAYHLTIERADLATVAGSGIREARGDRRFKGRRSPPNVRAEPTPCLLDLFEARSLVEPVFDVWPRFRLDLSRFLAAERSDALQEELIQKVSDAFAGGSGEAAMQLPMALDVENVPGALATRLSVRSPDLPGFLFAFANALAAFRINVERGEIRTVDGEAQNLFWITDAQHRPIVDESGVEELLAATSLIKQFTFLLPRSPNPGLALRQFNALIAQLRSHPAWVSDLARLDAPGVLESLAELMGVSRFLWEDFLRMQHESLFPLLLDQGALAQARDRASFQSELARRLPARATQAERVAELNAFKDREMFRIDLRHIVGRSGFREFSGELTTLAEVAVATASDLAIEELEPKFGRARLADGQICPWCVCALGKFGGGELGFGSDLELNFLYEEQGSTDGPTVLPNSEYFGYVVSSFVRTLKARQEGIFEVDLRLRPFGRAGALAFSYDGFRSYYAPGGGAEQFERLALVRLRPVAGDSDLGRRISDARDAFVYSGRPLDLGNVLHLRHRQATELVPRGQTNAKYSAGGVVDLEYFVQAWQITVGASDPSVRVPSTLAALEQLARGGYLDRDLVRDVEGTYLFLRRLIDALRVVRGHAKDLTIPPDDSREFAYLARRLKLATPAELRDMITTRMAHARGLWTLAPPRTQTPST